MGKSWDSTGIAYSVELWRECLRVLKPGGHLLAFGGSRTWHRVAVAIEDAGFELRDSIAWLYGSGFPKSLDISKAIDKGTGENFDRQLKFTNWMRSTGLTSAKARHILLEAELITEKSSQASHYFAETMGSQPAIATAEMFDALRSYLPEVPEEIERLVAERTGIEWTAYKNREVIGTKFSGIANAAEKDRHTIGASKAVEVDVTAPATDEAKQWQGWGTALKPAFEPIVVGRKPLIGTVAANVLEWGVGGLNIDASRIGTEERSNQPAGNKANADGVYKFSNDEVDAFNGAEATNVQGRWPANIILDDFTAGLLDEQSGVGVSKSGGMSGGESASVYGQYKSTPRTGHDDSGGASRFFYVAKASKRDRNEGLNELPFVEGGSLSGGEDKRVGKTNQPMRQNFHPTVKPTDLMRYLIKLVTPAGGVVLDPFTGSGSTGKAALLDGYRFVGIEMTADYLPIIEGRLLWAEAEAQRVAQAAAEEESIRLF
jgi:DNA modification methylase